MKLSLTKNLVPFKEQGKNSIDNKIGEIRKLFVTSVPGQDMVYMEKRIEAELVIEDPLVDPEKIPHIVSEASMNGISIEDQANIIISQAQSWKEMSSILERVRLEKKTLIDEANSENQIQNIINSIETELAPYLPN